MKIKQILLVILALGLGTAFLYPMYINTTKKECCEEVKTQLSQNQKELSKKNLEILKLKNSLLERENEILLTNEEVKRLSDENGIFTSMLSEIEGQPGGHEILKYLWNEMGHSK